MRSGWPKYLAAFHAGRAGITEHVLRRARLDGRDAYDWLADAVPPAGLVLDVACGSAPLRVRLPGRSYLGVDLSATELAVARRGGADRLAQASATAVPLAAGSVDVVVCSMALHIVTPLPAALAEAVRVLTPGGRLVATLPDRGPLRVGDLPVLTGLLMILGRRLRYPNDGLLEALPDVLARVGLRRLTDDRRRFPYRLRSRADADLFLDSLYLPGLPRGRYRAARAFLRTLARTGINLPVPIRRVVADRA